VRDSRPDLSSKGGVRKNRRQSRPVDEWKISCPEKPEKKKKKDRTSKSEASQSIMLRAIQREDQTGKQEEEKKNKSCA